MSNSSVTFPGLHQDATKIQTCRAAEDIVTEILVKLPVKSLLRFRCVCKFWNSLISSKTFVKAHFEMSRKNTDFTYDSIISTSFTEVYVKVYSLRSILYEQTFISPDVCCSFSNSPVTVLGCCNGLCCIDVGSRFVLWNPFTRKLNVLPTLETMSSLNHGFGFDGSDDGFEILYTAVGVSAQGRQEILPQMYNLKTNSWTVVQNFKDYCSQCGGKGVFVNGKLHWLTTDGTGIITFDMESEVGDLIAKPSYISEELPQVHLTLGELGGSLCIVLDSPEIKKELWVLKDSWEKLVTIANVTPSWELDLAGLWMCYKPLCILAEGEILFVEGSNFVIYDPKGNSRRICNLLEADEVYGSASLELKAYTSLELEVYGNVQGLISPFPHGED